jgi:hypothetical protein
MLRRSKRMKLLGTILRYRAKSANISMSGTFTDLFFPKDDLEHHNPHRHGFRHLILRGNVCRSSLFASWEHSGRVATARDNKRQTE